MSSPARTGSRSGPTTVAVLCPVVTVIVEDVRGEVGGGELRVTVDRDCETVKALWLTGPTNMVCSGLIQDEELAI